MPDPIAPQPDVMPSPIEADLPLMVGDDVVEAPLVEAQLVETRSVEASSVEAPSDCATDLEIAPQPAEEISGVTAAKPPENETKSATGRDRHVNLVQIVRDWLWRAA
jgi:hypothetical protein